MQLVHPLRGLGAARADDSTTSLRPAITKRKALGDGSVGSGWMNLVGRTCRGVRSSRCDQQLDRE